ncbi:MAG: GNAT family N-acetyltransferase [Chloroflexia bacterium]|nr:GNAT family N-acetyltransferase [Chloroflexia bacterium]
MIETDRLLLRPMIAEDIDPLLMVFGDPLVMAAFDSAPFDRARMEDWVQRNLDHKDRHGYGLFTVILKEPGAIIGDCGLERMELDDGPATGSAVELGYDLRSDFWNRGLATEAAVAVRDHAFGTLRLPRLVSLIRQGNIASRRVAEKIGMRHERDIVRSDHPYWLFGIDAPDRAFVGDPTAITR